MLGPLILLLTAAVTAIARLRRRERLPAKSVIVSPRTSTVVDDHGAVRSVQSAEITMSAADLERMWIPANLQNLARTYWRFLSRVTLGLVRVVYGTHERSVVLLAKPLTLLRFAAPDYTYEPGHAHVRWQIKDGLLVSHRGCGCGHLALDIRLLEADDEGHKKLLIEVVVANFYPSIASGLSMPVYKLTQSYIHVLVTHAFLRSLASLDLAQSKVGPFVIATGPIADEELAEDGAVGQP